MEYAWNIRNKPPDGPISMPGGQTLRLSRIAGPAGPGGPCFTGAVDEP